MGGRCDLPSWDLPGRGPSPTSRPTPSLGFRGRRAQARHVPPRRIGRAPAHCNDGAEEVEGVGGLQVVASTQVVQDEARQWPRLLGLPRGPCLRSLPPHALGLACPQRMLLRRFVGHGRRPRAGFESPGPLRSLLGRHQKLLLRQLLGTLHIVLLHLCGWAAGEAGLLMQRPGQRGVQAVFKVGRLGRGLQKRLQRCCQATAGVAGQVQTRGAEVVSAHLQKQRECPAALVEGRAGLGLEAQL